MKKIELKQFDEVGYEEVLENGLRVHIWHKPSFRTTQCVLATPYGSLDCNQWVDGKLVEHPKGIAHFLEHKLFESGHEDVMSEFSRLGADVNAFTSYNETAYYFTLTTDEIEQPLCLLLDFVQNLDISEESVEKEKGIICRELDMYLQDPESRLIFETFKALYSSYPYRYDIGGDSASVRATTKEDLKRCYQMNYHPSRMMLSIATGLDPEYLMNIIRDNQAKKTFAKGMEVSRYLTEEPVEVASEYVQIQMDVKSQKCAVAYKLAPLKWSPEQRVQWDWAMNLCLEAHFKAMNPDYQKWIDDGKINLYFDFEAELNQEASYLLFINETDDARGFRSFLDEEISKWKKAPISEQQLQQFKRRSQGALLRSFNSIQNLPMNWFRHEQKGVSIEKEAELLEALTTDLCREIVNQFDYSQVCIVVIHPESHVCLNG